MSGKRKKGTLFLMHKKGRFLHSPRSEKVAFLLIQERGRGEELPLASHWESKKGKEKGGLLSEKKN